MTAGLACCFNTDMQAGTCVMSGVSCGEGVNNQINVMCDGPEDCPGGQLCCAVGPAMKCSLSCGPYAEVCHSSKTCAVGTCLPRAYSNGFYELCK